MNFSCSRRVHLPLTRAFSVQSVIFKYFEFKYYYIQINHTFLGSNSLNQTHHQDTAHFIESISFFIYSRSRYSFEPSPPSCGFRCTREHTTAAFALDWLRLFLLASRKFIGELRDCYSCAYFLLRSGL